MVAASILWAATWFLRTIRPSVARLSTDTQKPRFAPGLFFQAAFNGSPFKSLSITLSGISHLVPKRMAPGTSPLDNAT